MGLRDTPATYSADEAAAIHNQAAHDQPLVCPRCGHGLDLGPTMVRDGKRMAEARCPSCHRCLMVRRGSDDPDHRLPSGSE